MNEAQKQFFQAMEEGITNLPQEQKEQIFRPCAEKCAKEYVLEQQRKIFAECNGDMDTFYSRPDTEYLFTKVIEQGHIYEMGYPGCLCYMYESGFAKSEVICECSRQSIIYILSELLPNKRVTVETVQTVLGGADKCVFRITVE